MFELSAHLSGFSPEKNFKFLSGTEISVTAAAAYRGEILSVGQLVSDSLSGWHDPGNVNKHMEGFIPGNFFNKADQTELRLLWQLRHSIAHTAG